MKHFIFSSILFSLLVLTVSCSTFYIVGKDFDESKVNSLVIGETSKSQVLQLLGDPYDQGRINQYTVFIYSYEENEFPANSRYKVYIDKKQKSLMILFDENSDVKFFTHNVPLSFSALEAMILNEEKLKQQKNNDNINPGNY